jgi:hypothetical protein
MYRLFLLFSGLLRRSAPRNDTTTVSLRNMKQYTFSIIPHMEIRETKNVFRHCETQSVAAIQKNKEIKKTIQENINYQFQI